LNLVIHLFSGTVSVALIVGLLVYEHRRTEDLVLPALSEPRLRHFLLSMITIALVAVLAFVSTLWFNLPGGSLVFSVSIVTVLVIGAALTGISLARCVRYRSSAFLLDMSIGMAGVLFAAVSLLSLCGYALFGN
jgi:hypothetical protein